MGTVARRLNLRCFIDGIEVPAIGARCTFSEGAAATAEVQLVATDEAMGIEPRAFVTLYYYDNYDYDLAPTGLALRRLGPDDLRRWKLLFAGEYISYGFAKQAGARSCSIVCVDHTSYWDFLKQYYINFANAGIELFENAFLGVKLDRVKFFDIVGKDFASNLFVWLTKSKGPDGKPNLYLGVQRMLREMWFSSNDFYARAFNRLRVGDQLVGIPSDQTAAKLFELEFFKKFIENQLGGGGAEVTVRQLVDSLLGNVFHTYVTVPAPRFDRKGTARGFSPDSKSSQDQALLSENIDRSRSWPNASLNYTVIKPDTWFLAPPACNILFPHQYSALSFQRNFLQEPTRLFLRTSLAFIGSDKWITDHIFAPDFDSMNEVLYKEGGYLRRLAQTLLSHEDMVGINPAMLWQEDLSCYVQKGSRRQYLGRLADYLFWKMRFGPRSLNVSGPFNPRPIPGYPGLVINNVGRVGQFPKHYLGNIQTVTHVLTQAEGGWTHLTFAGAHVHDETVDFDEKGRSLEEVANRGTDGFIDDRYDSTRIGNEVYDVLFGCKSTYEVYQTALTSDEDTLTQRLNALKTAGMGDIALSAEAVHGLYQNVVQSSGDVDVFTQGLTWRPSANLLEMMGTDLVSIDYGNRELAVDPVQLAKEDFDLATNEGFFASCVDPTAYTTVHATFTAVSRRMIPKVTTTVVPEVSIPVGNQNSRLILSPEVVKTSTQYQEVAAKTKGNYELANHLEARQTKVLSYAQSLSLRGLRG